MRVAGQAGGVKVVKSLDEVADVAGEILGKTLVTHQTGPGGARFAACMLRMAATSPMNSISRCLSIVAPAGLQSSPRARAEWISRKWRPVSQRRFSRWRLTLLPACNHIICADSPVFLVCLVAPPTAAPFSAWNFHGIQCA